MPASFDVAAVAAEIAGTQFAGLLQHFNTVDSTSTLALEAAQAGTAGGVWVAEEQTAGRGRGGHRWHSAASDGLYVSILVRPELALARALWLSLATGLSAQAAIKQVTGLMADIRWPNDLLLAGRKCGGILVETSVAAKTEPPRLRYAVIGIGINVNHAEFPPELVVLATSLRRESGQSWQRERLLSALLSALDDELRLLQAGEVALLERFERGSSWVRGKRVRVEENGGYTGVTAGLNADGFLLVDGDEGVRHTMLSGGVREVS